MLAKGSPLGIAIVAVSMIFTGILLLFTPVNKWAGIILLSQGIVFITLSRWMKKYLK